VNSLWTGPGLRWKPFSGAAGACLLYLAAAAFARAQVNPQSSVFLPLFAAIFLPFPRHVFARFARTEATEWMMGLGWDRRRLAFRFSLDLFWWSLVHALGGACLLALVPKFTLFHQSEWGQSRGVLEIGLAIFLVQLTARSAFAIVANADRSTILPPRMMDAFGGTYVSIWANVAWFLLGLLMLGVLVVAPIALVALTRSFLWLAVPAALYLRLAHALAASSEFVRKATPPVDPWGLPVAAPGPALPREFFGGLRSDRAAAAPLRGLLWDGMGRGMRRILLLLLGVLAGVGVWWIETPAGDREIPQRFFALLVTSILAFFVIAGQKVFAWTRSDDAVEYLFVRGVTLRTLDRVRMTWGMLVTGAALGAIGLFHLWLRESRGEFFFPFWALGLYVGAALLLECNRRALPRRFLRLASYADLGRILRLSWWFLYALFGGIGGWLLGAQSRGWLAIGLILFVPALMAWLRSFLPLLVRR
jgi:hypothetical protein